MRTRNADAAKSITPKKSTTARKTAVKSPPDSATAEEKRSVLAKAKQSKIMEPSTPSSITVSDSKPDHQSTEETPVISSEAKAAPKKRTVVRKVVKRVVKKTVGKAKTTASDVKEVGDVEMPRAKTEVENVEDKDEVEVPSVEKVGELKKEEVISEVGEHGIGNVEESALKIDEPVIESENVEEVAGEDTSEKGENATSEKGENASNAKEESVTNEKEDNVINEREENAMEVDVAPKEVMESSKDQEPSDEDKRKEVNEGRKDVDIEEENIVEALENRENVNDALQSEGTQVVQDDYGGDEGYEEYADRVDLEDHGEDDFVEEDPEEPMEESEELEEERKELTAVAKERKIKKEYEIFVGGLDREATEEDVRKVFETIGEVVDVRLHRNLLTNKSKGYAFVRFANKEHAKRALSEMKNPVIRGKRCGTAPSEDNDTLFLGNICNTWTKEAIRRKLKDYGIEGVENITLVADVQHEGRSRGFAFLEFSCHADAMHAYKRLQKPDVVFGHPERTAKVAFAEPIREPDPEVMAHVKTVFLDGLPPHWDEDCVRQHLHGYGEIVRIVLARNMSTAKRKDFGFVDFSSHEDAVACIERINNAELVDGNSKMRVRARLSNPMPKTQAVKGGMCGGFLIDRGGSGTSSRFGRSFGRTGHQFNRVNFQRGRGFYHTGRGQSSRMGPNEYDFSNRPMGFHGRQIAAQGGRRGPVRGSYPPGGRGFGGNGPSRTNFNRPWHDAPERRHTDHASSRRQPFSPEAAFDRPYVGRNFDDPYLYDDGSHGMKRPFYMTDHDPDYAEPSRHRPRFDYTDPAVSFRGAGAHYPDTYRASGDPYSHGYYGPDYGPYPPYYRGDGPYRGGYYY